MSRTPINQNLKIIIYFCLKFFEGFLGEAFFQESSPKRVPYKSKFEGYIILVDIFDVKDIFSNFLCFFPES